MSRADKEALIFGAFLFTLFFIGTGIILFQEHQRNAACAELGGIVVDLKCGKFEVIGDAK